MVGLSLAYFAYRHDLPLTIRSTLYPLLGRRIYGAAGDTVEILAVFGTLFGVATSLGLGVMQINAGPTIFLLSSFVQSLGHYAQTLLGMSFRTTPFRGTEWQASWTMFYWGWWISWSPFVGMFIARISRGRTIRGFIGGALLAPTLLTFFWFIVFGNTALHMEVFGAGGISAA